MNILHAIGYGLITLGVGLTLPAWMFGLFGDNEKALGFFIAALIILSIGVVCVNL